MTTAMTDRLTTETIAFDHAKLSQICDTYGAQAEFFLANLLGEVEDKITEARHQMNAPDALRKTCGELVDLARTLGMITVEQVATAVLDGLARQDLAAASACLSRLCRLTRADSPGEWSLEQGAFPDTVA